MSIPARRHNPLIGEAAQHLSQLYPDTRWVIDEAIVRGYRQDGVTIVLSLPETLSRVDGGPLWRCDISGGQLGFGSDPQAALLEAESDKPGPSRITPQPTDRPPRDLRQILDQVADGIVVVLILACVLTTLWRVAVLFGLVSE